jgi:hypothetical protein
MNLEVKKRLSVHQYKDIPVGSIFKVLPAASYYFVKHCNVDVVLCETITGNTANVGRSMDACLPETEVRLYEIESMTLKEI